MIAPNWTLLHLACTADFFMTTNGCICKDYFVQFKLAATIGHGKNSLGTMCSPIILLGEPVKTGATKFSVNGNDTLAIVTPHFCVRSLLHEISQRDVWSIKHKQEEDAQICSPWPNT